MAGWASGLRSCVTSLSCMGARCPRRATAMGTARHSPCAFRCWVLARSPNRRCSPLADGSASATRAGVLDWLNVLVVEDDDGRARSDHHHAASCGRAVLLRSVSARGARAARDRSVPDIVVSDIAMPNGTGYDLVKQVRATPALARIPAIALTAYGRLEDRERALSAGFNYPHGQARRAAASGACGGGRRCIRHDARVTTAWRSP